MVVLGAYFDPGRATVVGQVAAKFEKWKEMTDKASLLSFTSVQTNMGMVIDRKLYTQLVGCTEAFCTWPDYNWDWSFQVRTLRQVEDAEIPFICFCFQMPCDMRQLSLSALLPRRPSNENATP